MQITASQHASSYLAPSGPSGRGVAPAGNANAAASGANSKSDPAAQRAEQQTLDKLKARDREVRAHELAHQSAGGDLVRGGMSFTYQRGSDGQLYAVGGEVSIDTSPVNGDPAATLRKAEQIQRAALAPAQPSGQDRSVAAQAAGMAASARAELSRQSAVAAAGDANGAAPRIDLYA